MQRQLVNYKHKKDWIFYQGNWEQALVVKQKPLCGLNVAGLVHEQEHGRRG